MIPIMFCHLLPHIWCFARIVSCLEHVLKTFSVGLVFEGSAVAVSHCHFYQSCNVSNPVRTESCGDRTAKAKRQQLLLVVLELAPSMLLNGVRNLMADNGRKLGLVLNNPEHRGMYNHHAIGKSESIGLFF